MFVSFGPEDDVLHSRLFIQEEVEYNLIHQIAGDQEAMRLKTEENDLIFAHNGGYNSWLWLSPELDEERRCSLVRQLAEMLEDRGLPGVNGTPETGKLFADAYGELTGKTYQVRMMMEAYHCPQVQLPHGVSGKLHQAEPGDIPLIAGYLAGFVQDCFGMESAPEDHLDYAGAVTESGKLRLWIDKDQPVSMVNLAHQSARHARINEVYTPHEFRKHGYASAAVAALCAELLSRDITPMLYADAANPDSNKVYQSVGFKRTGSIVDLRFQ
ncbi:GCN5-like N-acetyltransferase [Paenibacillus sp. FSL R7-269]|uniref:GNAT family N-acetyltransferase n=1 Tax=Paenibacillus sp. FSL R7-269 TaxID=1226755 RepID=UPI0003E1D255|nr:GNAT family N-acetyltransferase [Paenibacillus sp. FSL R7-269]ETT44172.1 GCN5-like N-acetyltransferase [Paenibacillus sp. FSL R7-269]